MKKAKKLLVTLLVLTFVLSTMSVGFAATTSFSDIKNEDVASAVTRLSALDILNGYPDGTFKPDNPITRAEFAKIIVSAVGVGEAAEYAKGTTQFKDVPADYWAAGYIKVASDMKIVNGRGNGVFDPGANVTYAEAIAMIVRALGYEPKAQALGGYPGGYLAIASEKDITDGINVVNTLAATRGDIARMVDNSLDVKLMEQTSYGTETSYEEVDKTLLTSKLGLDKIEGRVIEDAKLNSDLKDNEVKIKITKVNDDDDAADVGKTNTYTVLAGDPNEILGAEVKAWINDDDEIVYVENTTDDENFFSDTVTDDTDIDTTNNDLDALYLDDKDESYDVASDAYIYINNTKINITNLPDAYNTATEWDGLYGRIVLDDDDNVIFADLYNWDKLEGEVVDSVSVDGDDYIIKYFKNSDTIKTLRLTGADKVTVVKDGKTIDFKDIAKDDVAYVADLGSDEYYIIVVSNKVEGKLEKAKEDEVTIDGKAYDVDSTVTTISSNNNDDIYLYSSSDGEDAQDDLLNENVTAILDINGDVRHIVGDTDSTSGSMYGIVIKTWSSDNDYAKIYTNNGEIVTYESDLSATDWAKIEDKDMNYADASHPFTFIKFKLDSDGMLDSIEDVKDLYGQQVSSGDNAPVYAVNAAGTPDDPIDDDDDYILINGSRYYVDDDTPIFNLDIIDNGENFSAADEDDIEMLNWTNDVEDIDTGTLRVAVIGDAGKEADALVILNGVDESGSDDIYTGIVTDRFKNSDGDWTVTVNNGTETKDYIFADDNEKSEAPIGAVITYALNGKEEIKDIENINTYDATLTSGERGITVVTQVYDIDDNFITLDNDHTTSYKVASNAVIYDVTDVDGFESSKTDAQIITNLTSLNGFDIDDAEEIDLADLTDGDESATDIVKVFINDSGIVKAILVGRFK